MGERKWGSCRKRGKNSWEIRYPSLNEDGTPGKPVSETIHGTEADAEIALRFRKAEYETLKKKAEAMRQLVLDGLSYQDVPDTVDQIWFSLYLPYAQERVECEALAESTLVSYKRLYNNHVKRRFGKRPINSILHAEVQQHLKTLTYPQAKHVVSVMRLLWNFAASENGGYALKARNIMRERFDFPPKSKRSFKACHDVYSAEEFDELLSGFCGHPLEPYVLLMGVGGARAGEACGVIPSEIRFDHFGSQRDQLCLWAIVPLNRTVIKIDGKTSVKNTLKTTASRRSIYIPEPYSKRLKELVESCPTTFFNEDLQGIPFSPSDNSWMWRDWFRTHSLKYIPMKNLRNTRASILLSQGYSEELVMRLLGHTSLTMLHEHYDRRTDEMFIEQLMGMRRRDNAGLVDKANFAANDVPSLIKLVQSLGFDVSLKDAALI